MPFTPMITALIDTFAAALSVPYAVPLFSVEELAPEDTT